jgi:hypothetical protein
MGYLTPVTRTETRPAPDQPGLVYIRAWLLLRAVVGVVGLLLPLATVLVDRMLGGDRLLGSLSAYYYAGSRDLFVGLLYSIGIFLLLYKISEVNLDNTLSALAGLAALGVASCPTGRSGGVTIPLTRLQQTFGEAVVGRVHYGSACLLMLCLAGLSICFGRRERTRAAHGARLSRGFWAGYHWFFSGLILVAIAFMCVGALSHWGGSWLFWGETVCVMAFAASWLMKGLELKTLRGDTRPDPGEVGAAAGGPAPSAHPVTVH